MPDPTPVPAGTGWQARLALRFAAAAGGATRLVHNRHVGPLRLIRALPQPDGRCDAVIVHPPGGLVGGDSLHLELSLAERTRVLCTTPGAQKWYRTPAAGAIAHTGVTVGPGAALEWLPQPTIVYDGARVDQSIRFELAADARMIGWECVVLGRAAMGERFARGRLCQRVALSVDGVPAWAEHTAADAADRLFASPLGWGGRTVACNVWAVGSAAQLPESLCDQWRAALDAACGSDEGVGARLDAGASRTLPGLLAARLVADDSQVVMRAAHALWSLARPALLGRWSAAPRIWAT